MSQVTKSNGSLTVYSLRRAIGMKARRASARNACIGAKLKGQKFSAPAGMGGRHNKALHAAFSAAAKSC